MVDNPFVWRAADRLEDIEDFLDTFAAQALADLPAANEGRLCVFRAPPGGGKTSLLRVVSPRALFAISQQQRHFKSLLEVLTEKGYLDSKGQPQTLALYLPAWKHYVRLMDLDASLETHLGWFRALVNARAVQMSLRGALELHGAEFPRDLSRTAIAMTDENNRQAGLDAYKAAQSEEENVATLLDTLRVSPDQQTLGRAELPCFGVPTKWRVDLDGRNAAQNVIVCIDDVQDLAPVQRSTLFDLGRERGAQHGRWLAERTEAAGTQVLTEPDTLGDRDQVLVIPYQTRTYRTVALQAASLRLRKAPAPIRRDELSAYLLDETAPPNTPEIQEEVLQAIRKMAQQTDRERETEALIAARGNSWEDTIFLRALQIVLSRQALSPRLELFWDSGVPEDREADAEEIDQEDETLRPSAEIERGARAFLSREFSVPYYGGVRTVADLGSQNIEQFLALSAHLFGLVLGADAARRQPVITFLEQDAAIRRFAEQRMEQIPARVRHGNGVLQLIKGVGTFCEEETFRPNFPRKGVTGVSLFVPEWELLRKSRKQKENLALDVLQSATSNNILQFRQGGSKNRPRVVFYMNRLFCVTYGLPLPVGNYRRVSPSQLVTWCTGG